MCMRYYAALPPVFLHLCVQRTTIPTDPPKSRQHQTADPSFLPLRICNSLPREEKVWVPYHWYMQLSASLCKGSPVSAAPGHPALSSSWALLLHRAALCGRLLTQLGPVLPGRHTSTWAQTALLCRAPCPAGPTLACGTWLSWRCPPPALPGSFHPGVWCTGSALRCTPSSTPGAPTLVWCTRPSRRCHPHPHSWGPPPGVWCTGSAGDASPLLGRRTHVDLRAPHPGAWAFLILHKLQCRE